VNKSSENKSLNLVTSGHMYVAIDIIFSLWTHRAVCV